MQPTRTEPRLSPQSACSSFWREAMLTRCLKGGRRSPTASGPAHRARPEPVLLATGLERSSAAGAGNDG